MATVHTIVAWAKEVTARFEAHVVARSNKLLRDWILLRRLDTCRYWNECAWRVSSIPH